MFRNYLKIALKVLLRRKAFTFVSLFGISFTLLVLMVVAALLDHTFAPAAPEVRQARTLVLSRAQLLGDNATWSSDAGYELIERYGHDLPGVEALSAFSGGTVTTYQTGAPLRLDLKRTDAAFWRVLQFTFVEGAPFDESDVEQARFVAVVNAATRDRVFGGTSPLGRTIEVDGQRFRVVGVVENVSELRTIPFADVWVPLTTAKTDAWRKGLLGGFTGLALLRDASLAPAFQEAWQTRLRGAELPDPKAYKQLFAPFETRFESWARFALGTRGDYRSAADRLWAAMVIAALLFMLLPAINLVNLNVSRIMERASEIGVRKTFGASSRTLVGQFVVENLVLTLIGGAIGLALSSVALHVIGGSGLVRYANLQLNYRVFGYALGLSLAFGLVSGVYPAWRMSRLHPVDALRGDAR